MKKLRKRKKDYEKEPVRIEVADFETTVYDNQTFTEVWAAATVQIGTEEVQVFHSIDELFDYYCELDQKLIIYFHNLKFDGQFIIYYLSEVLHFKQAINPYHNDIEHDDVEFYKDYWMPEKSFKYVISDKGQWYSITIKVNYHIIKIKDSLKLLPFSVREIGRAFKTKHKKLDMQYEGFRYAGCEITDKEMEYIKNDVLVVKEALEFMFSQGHARATIGSCCLAEFKKIWYHDYDVLFPDLYKIAIDDCYRPPEYKPPVTEEEKLKEKPYTAGDYILRSYRGGWCYLVKDAAGKIKTNGTTADVNSLYPSVMHSESGNCYPIGKPKFWTGNYIPEEAADGRHYYFIRIRTRFYIKPGRLPFVQIKRNTLYKGNECLESSDIILDGKAYKWARVKDRLVDSRQTMTMTMTDYELFRDHYNVEEFEILDGCWFECTTGLFDRYIDKYKQIKLESKGAMRTLAKLFLNNLYGQTAKTTNSSFKVAVPIDGVMHYRLVRDFNKTPGYIACGSAITSYARNFTIRAAQANYHPGSRGFIYADTDSIHCDLQPDEIKGIKVHDKNFCCWKLEACWDRAIFVRQKTYIEHVTCEDLKEVEPYNSIKCAGMTNHCKRLFEASLEGGEINAGYLEDLSEIWSPEADGVIREGIEKQWTEDEKEFLFMEDGRIRRRSYNNFEIGLQIPGKLLPRTIRGGVVLYNDFYTMH